jgi:DNA-directed RNA polymerase subunit RPC12/RpoP
MISALLGCLRCGSILQNETALEGAGRECPDCGRLMVEVSLIQAGALSTAREREKERREELEAAFRRGGREQDA